MQKVSMAVCSGTPRADESIKCAGTSHKIPFGALLFAIYSSNQLTTATFSTPGLFVPDLLARINVIPFTPPKIVDCEKSLAMWALPQWSFPASGILSDSIRLR